MTIIAPDAIPDSGDATPPAVGTTTTTATGGWSFTLPDPLPSTIQPYADANGGVLNLMATANGYTTSGLLMTASDSLSAGVAEGAATTEASADARTYFAPDTVALHVDTDTTEAAVPTDSQAAQSQASQDVASPDSTNDYVAPPAWQSNDGSSVANYNPDLVGATNYSTAVPADNPCWISTTTKKTTIAYTVVGETHAYWNATAGFAYNSTMSTTIGTAWSANGTSWSISGSSSQTSSTGHSIGISGQGPYWAHQYKIPVKYRYVQVTETCAHTGKEYSYEIVAGGFSVPNGGAVGEVGKDVSSYDGYYPYHAAKWHGYIQARSSYTQESGKSLSYGVAASAFGVGLNATSTYNTSHVETINAGTSTAAEHDIFSPYGSVGGSSARVLYSY